MIGKGLPVAGVLVFWASGALANMVQSTLPIIVNPPLVITFTPAAPSISCSAAPGSQVAAISVTGGDGQPITLSISGDTTDFALSSTSLPSNVVVAPGGITSTNSKCPLSAPVTDQVTVTAMQP